MSEYSVVCFKPAEEDAELGDVAEEGTLDGGGGVGEERGEVVLDGGVKLGEAGVEVALCEWRPSTTISFFFSTRGSEAE